MTASSPAQPHPAVGVDLGGTKIAAAVVDEHGRIHGRAQGATPAREGPAAVLAAVAAVVRAACADAGLPEGPLGVGIGTAGIVDSGTGRVLSSTETFAGWVGTDLVAGLREAPGWALGNVPVVVHNDVDAHALGESWLGAGRGLESMVMVAVGTGVGAAVIGGDRVWTGARHAAGEIGHTPTPGASGLRCPCGRLGHLEALSAGPAMARRYHAETGLEVDGRGVFARAAAGDAVARWVIDEAATGLGRVLAGLAALLDPSAIVLGGGVSEAGPAWWRPVEKAFRAEVIDLLADLPLLSAELGAEAAVVGAARSVFARVTGSVPGAPVVSSGIEEDVW